MAKYIFMWFLHVKRVMCTLFSFSSLRTGIPPALKLAGLDNLWSFEPNAGTSHVVGPSMCLITCTLPYFQSQPGRKFRSMQSLVKVDHQPSMAGGLPFNWVVTSSAGLLSSICSSDTHNLLTVNLFNSTSFTELHFNVFGFLIAHEAMLAATIALITPK